MTIGDVIRRNAHLYPHQEAFVFPGRGRCSFEDHDRAVNRTVRALGAIGLDRGDRVALLAYTAPELLEVFGAGEKAGFISVPLNWRLTADEMAFILQDSGAVALGFDERHGSLASELAERVPTLVHSICLDGPRPGSHDLSALVREQPVTDPGLAVGGSDVAYILYTSGTTGRPKGVMIDHRGQLASALGVAFELGLQRDDRVLNALPLYHVGGRALVTDYLLIGATNVLLPRFDPAEALRIVGEERITTLITMPSTLIALLETYDSSLHDVRSIRTIFYSGGSLSYEVARRATDLFGPVLFQVYGMTENGSVITCLPKAAHVLDGGPAAAFRLASCGRPAAHVSVRLEGEDGSPAPPGEPGEILVRSLSLMRGYWGLPEATAEAWRGGWLHTGDVGRWDDDGYLYIVDRTKDMIKTGGENVYSREVEAALASHPAVLEAAVIGIPDPRWGEAVCAVVATVPGSEVTAEELSEHCRDLLAGFKRPRRIDFVERLPRNHSGKILKDELRQPYWAGRQKRVG